MSRPFQDLISRFWSKVDRGEPDQCWLWKACISNGYGAFWRNGKLERAHRIAYEITNGPVPDGCIVCHSCDNPPCCNPGHLWVGTCRDNTLDAVKKNRLNSPVGERAATAKLTKEDVMFIRSDPFHRQKDLASFFGVSPGTISMIRSKKRWAHLL